MTNNERAEKIQRNLGDMVPMRQIDCIKKHLDIACKEAVRAERKRILHGK